MIGRSRRRLSRAAALLATVGMLAPAAAGAQIGMPRPPEPRVPEFPAVDVVATEGRAFWVAPGVGVGSTGVGLSFDASYWSRRLYRLRVSLFSTEALAMGGTAGDPGESWLFEAAGLVGSGRPFQRNWLHLAAGLAIVSGETDDAEFETVGVAGEVEFISRRLPHISARAHANLNAELPYAALTLSLPIGVMPFVGAAGPLR